MTKLDGGAHDVPSPPMFSMMSLFLKVSLIQLIVDSFDSLLVNLGSTYDMV